MKITVRPGGITQTSTECIILGIYEGERSLEEPARAVDRASAGLLQEIMQSGDFKGERYRSFLLYNPGRSQPDASCWSGWENGKTAPWIK